MHRHHFHAQGPHGLEAGLQRGDAHVQRVAAAGGTCAQAHLAVLLHTGGVEHGAGPQGDAAVAAAEGDGAAVAAGRRGAGLQTGAGAGHGQVAACCQLDAGLVLALCQQAATDGQRSGVGLQADLADRQLAAGGQGLVAAAVAHRQPAAEHALASLRAIWRQPGCQRIQRHRHAAVQLQDGAVAAAAAACQQAVQLQAALRCRQLHPAALGRAGRAHVDPGRGQAVRRPGQLQMATLGHRVQRAARGVQRLPVEALGGAGQLQVGASVQPHIAGSRLQAEPARWQLHGAAHAHVGPLQRDGGAEWGGQWGTQRGASWRAGARRALQHQAACGVQRGLTAGAALHQRCNGAQLAGHLQAGVALQLQPLTGLQLHGGRARHTHRAWPHGQRAAGRLQLQQAAFDHRHRLAIHRAGAGVAQLQTLAAGLRHGAGAGTPLQPGRVKGQAVGGGAAEHAAAQQVDAAHATQGELAAGVGRRQQRAVQHQGAIVGALPIAAHLHPDATQAQGLAVQAGAAVQRGAQAAVQAEMAAGQAGGGAAGTGTATGTRQRQRARCAAAAVAPQAAVASVHAQGRAVACQGQCLGAAAAFGHDLHACGHQHLPGGGQGQVAQAQGLAVGVHHHVGGLGAHAAQRCAVGADAAGAAGTAQQHAGGAAGIELGRRQHQGVGQCGGGVVPHADRRARNAEIASGSAGSAARAELELAVQPQLGG